MNAKLQRRIQRYGWDKAALHYEGAWERQLAPAHRALLEDADLRPGERVVDIACGTGLVTFAARTPSIDGAWSSAPISPRRW